MKKIISIILLGLFGLTGCTDFDTNSYNVPTSVEATTSIVEQVAQPAKNGVSAQKVEVKKETITNSNKLSNDNYYINVDGDTVHSPAYAPSRPSGASAKCKDGTYSFSKNRRGTCSGHGGVSSWY